MTPRQTGHWPIRWLIVSKRNAADAEPAIASLPVDVGILWTSEVAPLPVGQSDRITLYERDGDFARIHDQRELTRALALGVPIVLLSPIRATRSHPGRESMPAMRAASLARLARRKCLVLALGGMNEDAFRRVAPFGFDGWAAIDGIRT